MFDYDVAISFAGEQRREAEAIAKCLTDSGVKVFYDKYEQANLWGKDLYEHLSDIYQNKARFCLMLVSAGYAEKVWATQERKSAQSRALSQKAEYILPIRFDETEIPGLLNTVGLLWFKDEGVQGICTKLVQKLSRDSYQSKTVALERQTVVPDPAEYWNQRKKLADTDILKNIWSKPRWRIWIRPTSFRKARFLSLDQCEQFINASYVRVKGWIPYPWFSPTSIASGDEWIASEISQSDGRFTRLERWVLFRSAQFVHNLAFDEIPELKGRVHVLEILDTTTAAFEFAARMAQLGFLSPEAGITFEMFGLDGRVLTWPKDFSYRDDEVREEKWCLDESLGVTRRFGMGEIEVGKRELALEVAMEIYSNFGWTDPPRDRLVSEQQKRFSTSLL